MFRILSDGDAKKKKRDFPLQRLLIDVQSSMPTVRWHARRVSTFMHASRKRVCKSWIACSTECNFVQALVLIDVDEDCIRGTDQS